MGDLEGEAVMVVISDAVSMPRGRLDVLWEEECTLKLGLELVLELEPELGLELETDSMLLSGGSSVKIHLL